MEYNIDDNTNFETETDVDFSTSEYMENDVTKDSLDNKFSSNPHPPKDFPNVFALFAKSLGIFSIFCAVFSIFFGAFICGGLAIILAFLSKGFDTKMEKNAKIGLATGIIGVTLQLGVLVFSVYNIIQVPEFREQFNIMYEKMYGVPVDESINEILDQLKISDSEGGIL